MLQRVLYHIVRYVAHIKEELDSTFRNVIGLLLQVTKGKQDEQNPLNTTKPIYTTSQTTVTLSHQLGWYSFRITRASALSIIVLGAWKSRLLARMFVSNQRLPLTLFVACLVLGSNCTQTNSKKSCKQFDHNYVTIKDGKERMQE